MRRAIGFVGAGALATGALVWSGAAPAGATVTATATGTEVTVTVAGDGSVAFACDDVTLMVLVNGTATTPPTPCATLTKAKVDGDGGRQVVDGTGLDGGAFAAKPKLAAVTTGGDDTVTGSSQQDSINTGDGADLVVVHASATADSWISMGPSGFDIDVLRFVGTAADDTITATGTSGVPDLTPPILPVVTWSAGGPPVSTTVVELRRIEIQGGAGDDTIGTAPPAPPVSDLQADGGTGDDTIDLSPRQTSLLTGGPGANVLRAGAQPDLIRSVSHLDTIDGRAGHDVIIDEVGPHAGGRTIVPSDGADTYQLLLDGDVGTVRVRPFPADGHDLRFTTSLNRPGQGTLDSIRDFSVHQQADGGPSDLTLFDLVLVPGTQSNVYGKAGSQDLADITVPVGAWTRQDDADATVVTPADPSLAAVTAQGMDEVSVHGPWADADEGFVHRCIRDLLYTFVDDAQRATRTAAIKAGTATRAGLVAEIMATNWYPGLDVDRAFLRFLRRGADPSGRAYWVKALAAGRPLWRFRAQLVGSNEYFTKAGGTDAAYVAKAYADILGRAPDPAGLAYWTHRLQTNPGRGMVALQFLNTRETRRRLADDQFLRFLDRLPTTAESDHWVAWLPRPAGEQQLIAELVAGAEYRARS